MEALILAGGLGTRLSKVVKDLPKPMAPVNGKPFLYYLFIWLKRYDVSSIVISAGYKHETIIDYFGDSFYDIPVKYAVENKPMGTGGAVINSLKYISSDNILIINGDTWFPIDLNEFYSRHVRHNHIFTIALKRMFDLSRYGSVKTEGHNITGFIEKKTLREGLINGGIYLVKRNFFKSVQFADVFSLEKDLLVREAGNSILKGIIFDAPFIDIGVPEDYTRAGTVVSDE